ncbi:MAG: ATP-binding protein [Candidatus Margulisiibacteriota bacterium]
MFKSLRSVLFLSFMGLVVVSLVVFLAVSMPSIRSTIISQVGKDSLERARAAVPVFSADLALGANRDVIQDKTEEAGKTSGNRITIIAKDGTVLADSQVDTKDIRTLDNHLDRPEILAAQKNDHGISVRYSATAKKDMIYAAVPIRDKSGKTAGFIRFSAPLLYAGEIYSSLYSATGLAFLAALIAAVVLSLILATWFFKPLNKLSRLSSDIVHGILPRHNLHRSAFEFGEIERSVEQISDRLADYFEKLSGEKGKLAGVLANMSEGVLAVDTRGKIMFANRKIREIFNIFREDPAGQTPRTALRNNEIADITEKVLSKPSESVDAELEIFSFEPSFFSVHAGALYSEKGELLGVVCVLHDLTKIRKLEKYRSEFIANVSHELKTPLTVIRNYVETLLNGAIEDRANNRNFLLKIEKHSDNLAALIDEILELSKLESGLAKKEFNPVNIRHILAKCVETLSGKTAKKNIKVETKCEDCQIYGMEDYIYRAILNLLDNAVNYTEAGGEIKVVCGKNSSGALIQISDTGIGIPKESLSRIFERFYRVDKGRSRDLGGTGLGLSIVKHIMELHGGNVSVESELGKGSVFTLYFPQKN